MGKEETMGKIRRVPESDSGTPDGVEGMVMCELTRFTCKRGKVTGIGTNTLVACKMMASFENGVVSFSVRSRMPFMVSVRLDELMALLKEAADYHSETDAQMIEKDEEE